MVLGDTNDQYGRRVSPLLSSGLDIALFSSAFGLGPVCSPFPWHCYVEQHSALQCTALPDTACPARRCSGVVWMWELSLLLTDSTEQMLEAVC